MASETAATVPDATILLKELAEQKDRYLRLTADFENFKKRTLRESKRVSMEKKEAFIREVLPVLDNLERALAVDPTPASSPLYKGVAITVQQLDQLLRRHGMEADDPVGQPFNPHRHEAVSTRQDLYQPDQTIVEVTQRGYSYGKQVIRPAQVIVNVLNS
jgi:molecular chaperone GrpE